MVQSKPPENGYKSRIRTSNIRLAAWSFAWIAAAALMKFGPKFLWNEAVLFTLLAVGLNLGMGVGMILATKKHVEELDELQRKVYLNALAITVGVAVIVAIPYSVMDIYHVIPFRANISHLVMLMSLTFVVSFVYGTWRYR